MSNKIEELKTNFEDLKEKIKGLNIEVTSWNFNVGKTEAGTSVEVSIKLLVPKKK